MASPFARLSSSPTASATTLRFRRLLEPALERAPPVVLGASWLYDDARQRDGVRLLEALRF